MRYATRQETLRLLAHAGNLIDSVHDAKWQHMESAIVYYDAAQGRPVYFAMSKRPHRQIVVIGAPVLRENFEACYLVLANELDEWLGMPQQKLDTYPQRLRDPESYASYVVMRAAYCAMDFGDTKVASYVQDCFEACTGDDKLYEEFVEQVREHLNEMGYRW